MKYDDSSVAMMFLGHCFFCFSQVILKYIKSAFNTIWKYGSKVTILSLNCSYNIIQFAQIKNYIIEFSIKGLLIYIENVIAIQMPVLLGYGIVFYCCRYNNIGMCLVGLIISVLLVFLSVLMMKKKIKCVFKNTVEFL